MAKPTPSKRSQEVDTSDRSERQNCSSQDILLNYAIITVSALEEQYQAMASCDSFEKLSSPNKTYEEIFKSFWIPASINCFCILVEINPKAIPSHFTHPTLSQQLHGRNPYTKYVFLTRWCFFSKSSKYTFQSLEEKKKLINSIFRSQNIKRNSKMLCLRCKLWW